MKKLSPLGGWSCWLVLALHDMRAGIAFFLQSRLSFVWAAIKMKKCFFILYYAHLIVPLTAVVIACAFVTKWRKNALTLNNLYKL